MPGPRAVAIPAREQDLARADTLALADPCHRVGSRDLAAAYHQHLPPLRHAARIDREHDALAAERLRELGQQLGTAHRGGDYAPPVPARRPKLARVVDAPHPAPPAQ